MDKRESGKKEKKVISRKGDKIISLLVVVIIAYALHQKSTCFFLYKAPAIEMPWFSC